MWSRKNLSFSNANFEIVFRKVFHPKDNSLMSFLGNLMTGGYKDSWNSRGIL